MENDIEDQDLLRQYSDKEATASAGNIILSIGVGGAGGNAISYMSRQGVQGVDFAILNTDKQALYSIPVERRILLGPVLCGGLGAGGVASVGRAAAEESAEEIEKLLTDNVKMVFVTAGMGGGTGTGAAPVVAAIARKRKILTVGIVTIPFFFEGLTKIQDAIAGAAKLQENVDALLVINNDRLATIYPDMKFDKAFEMADDVLTTAARTISDMVTTIANINIDMQDVDTCLRNGRTALISVGYGEGENRIQKAIRAALNSPLLCNTNIMTSKHLLFAIYYSHNIEPELKMSETQAANQMVEEINKQVRIKFGWGYDDSLENKIKFTILASGFDMTVDSNGHLQIIEGRNEPDTDEEPDWTLIQNTYGEDKVDGMRRRHETQNFYILTTAQLDDDDAIAMVEATPAFRRDKRKATIDAIKSKNADAGKDSTNSIDNLNLGLNDL